VNCQSLLPWVEYEEAGSVTCRRHSREACDGAIRPIVAPTWEGLPERWFQTRPDDRIDAQRSWPDAAKVVPAMGFRRL